MSVQLDFDVDILSRRIENDLESAAVKTLSGVASDIETFVPYNTGELNDSAIIDESSLSVVWEAEHAEYVYDMHKDTNFNRTVHERATSGWVEEGLAMFKDKWINDLKRNFSRR